MATKVGPVVEVMVVVLHRTQWHMVLLLLLMAPNLATRVMCNHRQQQQTMISRLQDMGVHRQLAMLKVCRHSLLEQRHMVVVASMIQLLRCLVVTIDFNVFLIG